MDADRGQRTGTGTREREQPNRKEEWQERNEIGGRESTNKERKEQKRKEEQQGRNEEALWRRQMNRPFRETLGSNSWVDSCQFPTTVSPHFPCRMWMEDASWYPQRGRNTFFLFHMQGRPPLSRRRGWTLGGGGFALWLWWPAMLCGGADIFFERAVRGQHSSQFWPFRCPTVIVTHRTARSTLPPSFIATTLQGWLAKEASCLYSSRSAVMTGVWCECTAPILEVCWSTTRGWSRVSS